MNSSEDYLGAILGIFALASLVLLVVVAATVAVPVAIVAFTSWAIHGFYFKSPAGREKKARERTQLIYEEAIKQIGPDDDLVFEKIIYPDIEHLPDDVYRIFSKVYQQLYDMEGFDMEIPPPPARCDGVEGARYRDYIADLSAKNNEGARRQLAETISLAFRSFLKHLPRFGDSVFTMRASDAPTKAKAVHNLTLPFLADNDFKLFKKLQLKLINNVKEVSPDNAILTPVDYEEDDVVFTYLKDTPLLQLFDISVPVDIPEKTRFEHTWCIAPPGTGKSQLIQYLVSQDLKKVENGEASIVVMDSQGDLIRNLSNLKLFALGQPLHSKLILIRPNLHHPPALNLFDMGKRRHGTYDEATREKLTANVIDQLTYVLDAMLGETATLTSKQETLYRYIIRLLMTLPNATLDTFGDLLSTNSLDGYPLGQLPKPARDFFETQFLAKEFAETKKQLAWRLSRLRENTLFDRMFSHSESYLDLFTELNESKVILIHTDKEHLKEEGTSVFGRYFIGALLSASQERASLRKRHPVFCYIDEAQDYIASDMKIATLLDQARKMNIGMFLAHQRTAQIKDKNVLDALANVSIKFANTDNPNDLPLVSKAMRCDPVFIAEQKKGYFAVSARREVEPFSFKVPFGVIEGMEKMSKEQRDQVRDDMRARFSEKYTPKEPEPTQPESPKTDSSEANIDGSKW